MTGARAQQVPSLPLSQDATCSGFQKIFVMGIALFEGFRLEKEVEKVICSIAIHLNDSNSLEILQIVN